MAFVFYFFLFKITPISFKLLLVLFFKCEIWIYYFFTKNCQVVTVFFKNINLTVPPTCLFLSLLNLKKKRSLFEKHNMFQSHLFSFSATKIEFFLKTYAKLTSTYFNFHYENMSMSRQYIFLFTIYFFRFKNF